MYFLRVQMNTKKLTYESIPDQYGLLGGRGLISALLTAELAPAADPQGPDALLILCNGLLAGTLAPTSGRLSIGGKSPLTGTIKESNAGGTAGLALAKLGLRAVILQGQSACMQVLVIGAEGAHLDDASALIGKGTYETCDLLRTRYGEKSAIICIGPAGERLYLNASIQVTDREGNPARAAARGGLGGVMGARGLKAIVLLEGSKKRELADPDRFKTASKAYTQALRGHPMTGTVLRKYGTASLVQIINEMGALPTKNFSSGQFEGSALLSGEHMAKLQQERNGNMTHACQVGCPIACSNVYIGPDGLYLTSGFEYETIALAGSNLGIHDLDAVAMIDRLCDDAGLDTMETGATMAVAAEAGILLYNDSTRVLDLIRQMAEGTPLGQELGQGTERFGQRHHVQRIPTVKGQAMSGYDPRALKGTGVTYATSTMGADHTAGNTLGIPELDPLSPHGQIEASRMTQQFIALFDSLGMCIFAGMPAADPTVFALLGEMLAGVYGGTWDTPRLLAIGKDTLLQERAFNELSGQNATQDDVPPFMRTEALPPHNTVFDVPAKDLAAFYTGFATNSVHG